MMAHADIGQCMAPKQIKGINPQIIYEISITNIRCRIMYAKHYSRFIRQLVNVGAIVD